MRSDSSPIPLKLDRSVPLVDAIFRVIEGTGTELEAVSILVGAENLYGVKLSTTKPPKPLKKIPVEKYSELIEDRMNQFLSATHLIIGSSEYSQLSIVLLGNYTYSWTHREWGHMLANWANETKWLGSDGWNYLDFYGGPNDRLIESYNAWCETLMRVIATKSDLELRES